MENVYCRFCAELKSVEWLLNLDSDDKKSCEVELMLAFLNAVYVNISQRSNIPNAICFTCYESLHSAYEFLRKVREAQDFLKSLLTENIPQKIECSFSNEPAVHFCIENDEPSALKVENFSVKEEKGYIQVKIEPEEILPENAFQDNTTEDQNEQNLNIPASINETNKITSEIKNHDKIEKTSSIINSSEVILINPEAKEKKTWKEYPWICKYCNDDFPDLDALRSHSKAEHDRCVAFTCVDCNEYKKMKGKNFSRFVLHVKKHRPMLRNFCHYCDEEVTQMKLHAHIKQHFKSPSLVCLACGEIFQNKDLCNQHTKEYFLKYKKCFSKPPTPTPEDLTCDICKKVYNSQKYLRDHMKRHDSDRNKTHACDRCGKAYYDQCTLKSHIEMIHEKIHPYACKICNKSFRYASRLKKHVALHSADKPFTCEECGRKFRLERHKIEHKIVHTDTMPYSCELCPKKFRFAGMLKQHLRQHTGEKPYSCDICLKTFTNWGNHNKHMKGRHNVETAKTKRTPQGIFPVNPETGQVENNVEEFEDWKREVSVTKRRVKKNLKDTIGTVTVISADIP